MGRLRMNDHAAKADAIFALTALSEDDVEPETAAVVVSNELSILFPLAPRSAA